MYVQEHQLGECYGAETGFILARDPDVVLAPDLAFISRDRVPTGADEVSFLEIAPELVVEVISPSDRSRDVIAKAHEYLEAGVALIWLIDPEDQVVTVYEPESRPHTLTVDDTLDGGEVLPGFSLQLAQLFRPAGA